MNEIKGKNTPGDFLKAKNVSIVSEEWTIIYMLIQKPSYSNKLGSALQGLFMDMILLESIE